MSAMATVVPSRLTSRRPRYQAPGVCRSAIGLAIRSNRCLSGAAPSRVRACEMPDLLATVTVWPDSQRKPSSRHRSTSPYEARAYSARAMT
jgi:hypothetical protein